MKQSEIDRALILVFRSLNAHVEVNYVLLPSKVQELCKNAKDKDELVSTLRRIADNVEKNY